MTNKILDQLSGKGNNRRESVTTQEVSNGAADFETAITAAGFGKYNIMLMLVLLPSSWATLMESTVMSYVMPAAQCDLNLTLSNKGILNSTAFLGMILSGPIWGFVLDTLGRRKLLCIGMLMESLLMAAASLSGSFTFLVISKLIGGSLTGGLYIAYTTYFQEFHSAQYRNKIQMVLGVCFCCCNIALPLLSSFFLPLDFHKTFFSIEFHGWNLLILVCSSASLISGIAYIFLPETPKFLMTSGKNKEALEVLKKVYSVNTGKTPNSYPILKLIEETENDKEVASEKKSFDEYVRQGWKQISPLFGREYGPKLVLVVLMESCIQMSINTLRLWSPQIFQSIHEYKVANNGSTSDLCTMMEIFRPSEEDSDCSVNLENNFLVYFNSMVIAMVTMATYIAAGFLINYFGKKRLITVTGAATGFAAIAIYFSQGPVTILAAISINLAIANLCFDVIILLIVVIFPTTLRAMAISVTMLLGRSLSAAGNIVFPMLLRIGCEPPFFTLAGMAFFATTLAYHLPDTENKHLK